MEKLYIPLILGTTRVGRYSEHAANAVFEEFKAINEVETELIDIRDLPFNMSDEGEDQKDPGFAKKAERADGFIIVTPEYNRSFPGSLKHALDTNYKEYRYKAVGLVGVSSGGFGGVRAIAALLPSLKTYGMYPVRPEISFSNVKEIFDEQGNVKDQESLEEIKMNLPGFFSEVIKVSRVLKSLREKN